MRPIQINILVIVLLSTLTATMGYHVAVFMPCIGSHIRAFTGIIRELIHQNHTVTSVVHQECHKYFDTFRNNHILLKNYGLIEIAKASSSNFIEGIKILFSDNLIVHEDVLKYFQENRIDAILTSLVVQSSFQIADKFNIPILMNSHQLGLVIKEKCPGCSYTGFGSLPTPLSSLNPSLIVTLINIYSTHIFAVYFHSLTKTIDSDRRRLGLKEISPKFAIMYNAARFPIVYQTYYPLVPPSISLPDGRWMVGHIPAEELGKEPLNEEYASFLRDQSLPVIYIGFGTIVQLQNEELLSIYRQITTQNVYKVIWSVRTSQQQQLSQLLQFSGLDEFQSKLPSHVKVVNFAPQAKLLDSDLVKLFVSHGGYSSVLESVDSGVPLILHPVFGDQFYNSNVMQDIGCGVVVKDLDELHEQVLAVMENYERYESCIENARERMSEAGGALQVVSILERMSEHGYEGMSFEYLMDGVNDFYSSLFILISTLLLPTLLPVIICYACCCWKKREGEKSKKE